MFVSGTLATPSTLPGYVFPLWPRAGLQSFHRHGFVFPGDLWRSVGSVCGFSWAWKIGDPIEPDLTIFESWDVKERVDDTLSNEWFIAWGGSTAVAQKCNKTRVNEKHGRVDHSFFWLVFWSRVDTWISKGDTGILFVSLYERTKYWDPKQPERKKIYNNADRRGGGMSNDLDPHLTEE